MLSRREMSDLLPDDVILTDSSESQGSELKGRGIPLKACVDCGGVWKYTHYCPAEFEKCGSCEKTGHYTRFCRFSTMNDSGVDDNGPENRSDGRCSEGQGEKCEQTSPQKDENKENSNCQEAHDFYENSHCENEEKRKHSLTEENDENHDGKESRYSPRPEANPSGPSHTFVPETQYESIELKKKLAKQFYEQGRYEAALSHYSRLTELCPNDALIFNNKCACYMMLGQYENAFADAIRVINLDPSSIKGHCRLMKCGILLGTTTLVELSSSKLSLLDPNNETLRYARDRLNELKNYLEKEKIAVNDKNYEEALKIVKHCLHISPLSLPFKLKEAEYLVLVERFGESAQLINEIIQKNPGNIEAKYIRGLILYYTESMQENSRIVEYFKEILYSALDHEKSLAIYKKVERMHAIFAEGFKAIVSENYTEAHNLFSSALQIDLQNKRGKRIFYASMSVVSFRMRNYQQAINESSEAIKINSKSFSVLKLRGNAYLLLENYEEAIADFSRVCNLITDAECQASLKIAEERLALVKKTSYEILGVHENASITEIEKAYKNKAKIHHPDRHSGNTVEQKEMHERKFKSITLAYRTLQARLNGYKMENANKTCP